MKIQIVFMNENPIMAQQFPRIFQADEIRVEDGFLRLFRKEQVLYYTSGGVGNFYDNMKSVAMFNLSEIRHWCEVEREPTINEVRASFGLKPIENNTKGAEK